jgi:3-oxoacyl-[acyl-carrier-protein] synthase-3
VATAIHTTALSTDQGIRSSIAHGAAAAHECLRRSGVDPGRVDLLINTGIYRDANMVEPAMAALIQQDVGLNLDYVKNPAPTAAFSFDLMNGACGVLNAVQVGASYLDSGNAEYVLVVSGDAHPDGGAPTPDHPYATVGAAMLLARVPDPGAGFGPVRTAADPGGGPGAEGYLRLDRMGTAGRRQLTVERAPSYLDRLVDFAADTARRYAAEERVDLGRALLLTSQPAPDFAARLADRLGVDPAAAVAVTGVEGDPHTSALTFAYHQAAERGLLAGRDQLLFVAAGSGLSVACAGYRPPVEVR